MFGGVSALFEWDSAKGEYILTVGFVTRIFIFPVEFFFLWSQNLDIHNFIFMAKLLLKIAKSGGASGGFSTCGAGRKKISSREKIIHDQFVEYGRNAREWMRKCILLLPKIEQMRIWEKKGFPNIYVYAAKLAGMSRRAVDDALWIFDKIQDKPQLQKVVEKKGISSVRPIVTIATQESADFWAQKANEMSKHTLEVYVQEYKKACLGGVGAADGVGAPLRQGYAGSSAVADGLAAIGVGVDGTQIQPGLFEPKNKDNSRSGTKNNKVVGMELNQDTLEKLEKLKGWASWEDLMQQLLKEREELIESQKPQAVRTDSRHMPAAISRYVLARTNGQCAYPGCVRPYEIVHHTQRWALDHVHDPDRMEALCKAHERIAHHGLIECEERAAEDWSVRQEADEGSDKFAVDKKVQGFRKGEVV